MEFYKIAYEGQVAVIPEGGSLIAHEKTLEVKGADSVLLIMAVGTNYKMEQRVFLESDPKKKLEPYPHPHEKVSAIIENALQYSYGELLQRHTEDYRSLIERAAIDLGPRFLRILSYRIIRMASPIAIWRKCISHTADIC